MAHQFFHAHEPEPYRILGVDLRPFSLGHVILLHRLESAFVTAGEKSLNDLVVTVFFCALTYREGQSVLNTGKVLVKGKFLTRSQPLDKVMTAWVRDVGEFDFLQKSKEVEDYMKSGSQHPLVSSVHGYNPDTVACDCPFVQEVKVTLMSRMNFTEDELLDRCWSKCLWDYYTLRMLDGDVRIVEGKTLESAQVLADELQGKIDRRELTYVFGENKETKP